MPLEVRQIGIRLQVGDGGDGAGDDNQQGRRASTLDLLEDGRGDGDADRVRLVEQCVEAVLAELARRAER